MRLIRAWSDHAPRMIRAWNYKTEPACLQSWLFPLRQYILHWKSKYFVLRLFTQISSNAAPTTKVRLQHRQTLRLLPKVTLQYRQMLHLPRKMILQYDQMLHLPRKITFMIDLVPKLLLYSAVTLLSCYFTEPLLYWTVTLLSCYFTELIFSWAII